MAYTALARRYRSGQFDEVVGQEPIARTLRKAIETNRVGHAYLFTGTRGVGKTTMARLFAKALNTPGDQPPDVAKAIMEGRDTDVIEIDAASNRGVEEARELIANCIYRPLRGAWKIYIIDEVHMLTREAFNTLLKTMEEPPSHVKFVLCTTETHKVPATIQSRCQRFDFRPIPAKRIAEHLKGVISSEGLEADPAALAAIAREAEGSMRDALSLLDRLLASGEKRLTAALLEELLGMPDASLMDALFAAFGAGAPKAALETGDALLAKGSGAEQLVESMMNRLRDLLVIAACGEGTELIDRAPDDRAAMSALAARFEPAGLVHMIALCENVQARMRTTSSPRALFDALLARLALTDRIADAVAVARAGPAQGLEPPEKKAERLPAERPPGARPGAEPPGAAMPRVGAPPDRAASPIPASADLDEVWQRVRQGAGGGATSVMLDLLRLTALKGATAHVEAATPEAQSYAIGRIERLTAMLTAAAGRPMQVVLSLAHAAPAGAARAGAGAPDPRVEAEKIEIVRQAIELFDARVVRIEDDPGA